jgi:hypothetical protein
VRWWRIDARRRWLGCDHDHLDQYDLHDHDDDHHHDDHHHDDQRVRRRDGALRRGVHGHLQ